MPFSLVSCIFFLKQRWKEYDIREKQRLFACCFFFFCLVASALESRKEEEGERVIGVLISSSFFHLQFGIALLRSTSKHGGKVAKKVALDFCRGIFKEPPPF